MDSLLLIRKVIKHRFYKTFQKIGNSVPTFSKDQIKSFYLVLQSF